MQYSDYKCFRFGFDAGVAFVSINHPPINLLDEVLSQEFDKLGRQLEADDSVRVVVLQSDLPDFFIAHSGLGRVGAASKMVSVTRSFRLTQMIGERFKKPVYPEIFARFATSLIAHREPIRRPPESSALDYEAELAVAIGRRGRRIQPDRALDHVAGYSLFNDATIRDFQLRTPQWTIGKNFDATGAFGPWLVTPDAVPPGAHGLRIQGRLNGRVMQDATTDRLIFSVSALIEMISVAMSLEPGDVIITGTPGGVGAARKPPVFMQQGDIFEVEIEGIGVLSNPVQDG
jgi:2-keto-4-pentenoate hydratase/2-oxohepta-3-ene-1,7-dioic acid hydratase in catechol pathway